jgi:glycosyltransferase involved in cell wall biosynthesis
MKAAMISTILPRECGIATFTGDLINAMFDQHAGQRHEVIAVALNEPGGDHQYPDFVKLIIRQEKSEDYIQAARFINNTADVCFLQHEFNIFGDEQGKKILTLVEKLEVPLIVNLHTVLHEPSIIQKQIIQQLGSLAQRIIVMSKTASEFCQSIYEIPKNKLRVINHGIPDIRIDSFEARKRLNLPQELKVITSFGLLTRNKGVDIVLKSLPPVIEKHPEVRYLVLGKTHPAIRKMYGEKYRKYLGELASELNLSKHVIFKNEFISESDLNLYLAATDILITSYRNKDQISSGPLTFAMGAHTAVVSTPFWNAKEILAGGRGRLFGFNDSGRLEEILLDLLDHPQKLQELKSRAFEFGREIIWPKIGLKYVRLMEGVVKDFRRDKQKFRSA